MLLQALTMNTSFGGRVRAARKAKGLTGQDLATKAGIHRITLHRIESGESVPNVMLAARLAKALGIGLDSLTH